MLEMVSVTGLAPVRPCLKGRMRELLCIHGLKLASLAGYDPAIFRLRI